MSARSVPTRNIADSRAVVATKSLRHILRAFVLSTVPPLYWYEHSRETVDWIRFVPRFKAGSRRIVLQVIIASRTSGSMSIVLCVQ